MAITCLIHADAVAFLVSMTANLQCHACLMSVKQRSFNILYPSGRKYILQGKMKIEFEGELKL